jgi:hypothetical protein
MKIEHDDFEFHGGFRAPTLQILLHARLILLPEQILPEPIIIAPWAETVADAAILLRLHTPCCTQ